MQQQAIPAMLLTIDETGQALRMSRSSVYREILSGRLRSLKIGGKRRVSMQALVAYIETLEGSCQDEESTRGLSASAPMGMDVGRLRLPSLTATVNPSTGQRGKTLHRN